MGGKGCGKGGGGVRGKLESDAWSVHGVCAVYVKIGVRVGCAQIAVGEKRGGRGERGAGRAEGAGAGERARPRLALLLLPELVRGLVLLH
jgi:hypothetical protein